MSENSPRWPGKNGSPGLDFSPYRKTGDTTDTGTAVVDKAAAPAPTGRVPAVTSERVANTAKEWAAVPVSGMPTAPKVAEPKPTHPGTPPRQKPAAKPADQPKAAIAPAMKVVPLAPASADETKPERPSRRTRKARLRLSRIDPWSVMKTTLLFAIAFGIMLVVVVFVLWSVLAGSGALESAQTLLNTVLGSEGEGGENVLKIEDYLTVERVMGFAVLLAVIDAVIITAVATLFAFLYNLAATVMGGLEVTLAED